LEIEFFSMQRLHRILCATLLWSVLPVASKLSAQAVWTGASDSNWLNTGNWSPASLPTSGTWAKLESNGNTVLGSGSGSTDTLYVGYVGSGSANLLINGGGTLTSALGLIGHTTGSTALVQLNGGTWSATWDIFAGDYGAAIVSLTNNSTASAGDYVRAGWNTGASGVIVVDGSTLSAGTAMQIGHFGSGTLSLTNGASLNTPLLAIGSGSGGVGMVDLGDVTGLAGVDAINVNGNGFLQGNGYTLGVAVTVNSGGHLFADQDNALQFAPGGSLALNTGSQLNFQLNENTATYLSVIGSNFSAGSVTINVQELAGFGTGNVTYDLLDFSSANANSVTLANFTLGWAVTGYELAVNGDVLQLVAVPEPSTYAALAGLLAMTVALIRRHRAV
jgi:T5SS/PEP-CTERM-associated repeat protein